MRIAVLGGGNGGFAAAADLTEQGHQVAFWRRDSAAAQALAADSAIRLIDGRGERRVPIALISADLAQVVRGAELIVIALPATAQDELAPRLAPYLSDDQVVFLPPGSFGSFTMARQVKQAVAAAPRVTWAETGTLPWLARKRGADRVAITVRAVRLPVGVYPAARTAHALRTIGAAFPCVLPCGDALSGALMNAGPVIHPPLILMNAAPLQHFERWDIHNEGTQPAVRAVTDRLDAERIALREALGFDAPHFPLADHYHSDRWMYGDAHRALVKSGDWREAIDLHSHRYMTEDTVIGLCLMESIGRYVGVATPLASGLFAMAKAILGAEPMVGLRTFETLGLAGLPRDRLAQMLHEPA